MNIHSQNVRDEEFRDPVARQLHRESLIAQEKVTGAVEFSQRLRSKIESQTGAKTSIIVPVPEVPTGYNNRRLGRQVAGWLACAASLAAALWILVPIFNAAGVGEKEAVHADRELLTAPKNTEGALPVADAEKGLQLVNTGLGQTIQSVRMARTAIRDLLEPLRTTSPEISIDNVDDERTTTGFEYGEEHLVASFTAKVLGLEN